MKLLLNDKVTTYLKISMLFISILNWEYLKGENYVCSTGCSCIADCCFFRTVWLYSSWALYWYGGYFGSFV